MHSPQSSWAVAYFDGAVYASDAGGVYRWDGGTWRPTSNQAAVVSLDADTAKASLFASSMGQGVRALDTSGVWRDSDSGLTAHGSSGAIHVTSVTPTRGSRTYGSMMFAGVATSLDQGQSWGVLTATVPRGGAWRAIQLGSQLYLATGSGILRYDLPTTATAGPVWWVVMIGFITLASGLGLWIAALEPHPKRPRQPRDASPGA